MRYNEVPPGITSCQDRRVRQTCTLGGPNENPDGTLIVESNCKACRHFAYRGYIRGSLQPSEGPWQTTKKKITADVAILRLSVFAAMRHHCYMPDQREERGNSRALTFLYLGAVSLISLVSVVMLWLNP